AANLVALERLREAGVQVAVASGRHYQNIVSFNQIGLQEWVLSSNGAVISHAKTGQILLETTMPAPLVREVCERGRQLGMSLIAYHRDGAYIERDSSWTDLYAREAGWTPKRVAMESLPADGFQKIIWAEDPVLISRLAPALRNEFAGRLYVVPTNAHLLEFLAPAGNKAHGAKGLAKHLGIASINALAFGDGNNDVELLGWAGLSVAMDHGRESARKAARLISPIGPPETAFARAVDLALSPQPFPA
ncbi:MAG: HAD-superfamily hydrolase, subfamily, partial [Chthoniobacteraceae bacterium]|nr:HAD-superfamily hydrolase, subfamily [Chthoniobacteraceae bacterium]